ncbi:MAG: phosphoribosylformylglycinamidine synthase subunit PurQ [Verrucomicrobia bacterium]|nr:phosphoribosylformylglycinamidine synthase subunit PurQ [Verrucomicrobiota bacterium]
MSVRACILTGFGINCDYETAYAFRMAGADAVRVHINDLIDGHDSLDAYQILAFPGGFSFGDDIASGKVFAVKCTHTLRAQLDEFIAAQKLIIGICNGFQTLVKMRILPGTTDGGVQDEPHAVAKMRDTAQDAKGLSDAARNVQQATLTFNDSGRFEDRWVNLRVNIQSPCIWTRGIEQLYVPVRHGEGKFVPADEGVRKALAAGNQIVVQYATESGEPTNDYPLNPNGSADAIAGVCDPTGRIFGLMPHPECHIFPTQHPRWTRGLLPAEGPGVQIFRNAVEHAAR